MAATIISSSAATALSVASGIGRGLLCTALNSSIHGPLEMIWGSGAAPQDGFSWGLWGGAFATGLFAYGAWKWCNRPQQESS